MERTVSVPLLASLLAVHVFVLDLMFSLDGLGTLLYLTVVLVAGWLPSRSLLLGTAAVSSILAISGYYALQPESGVWMAVYVRGFLLVAIWTTAGALRYLGGPLPLTWPYRQRPITDPN